MIWQNASAVLYPSLLNKTCWYVLEPYWHQEWHLRSHLEHTSALLLWHLRGKYVNRENRSLSWDKEFLIKAAHTKYVEQGNRVRNQIRSQIQFLQLKVTCPLFIGFESTYTAKINEQPLQGFWKREWAMFCCKHCSMLSLVDNILFICSFYHLENGAIKA